MLFLAVIQVQHNDKEKWIHYWEEETILEKLLEELPPNQRPSVENAWYKIIKDFRKETVKNV